MPKNESIYPLYTICKKICLNENKDNLEKVIHYVIIILFILINMNKIYFIINRQKHLHSHSH